MCSAVQHSTVQHCTVHSWIRASLEHGPITLIDIPEIVHNQHPGSVRSDFNIEKIEIVLVQVEWKCRQKCTSGVNHGAKGSALRILVAYCTCVRNLWIVNSVQLAQLPEFSVDFYAWHSLRHHSWLSWIQHNNFILWFVNRGCTSASWKEARSIDSLALLSALVSQFESRNVWIVNLNIICELWILLENGTFWNIDA